MHVCVVWGELNKQISDCRVVYDTEREINKGEKKIWKGRGPLLLERCVGIWELEADWVCESNRWKG